MQSFRHSPIVTHIFARRFIGTVPCTRSGLLPERYRYVGITLFKRPNSAGCAFLVNLLVMWDCLNLAPPVAGENSWAVRKKAQASSFEEA
jgi:hypothetical protein